MDGSDLVRQPTSQLCRCLSGMRRFRRNPSFQHKHGTFGLFYHRRSHLLAFISPFRQSDHLYLRVMLHVHHAGRYRWPRLLRQAIRSRYCPVISTVVNESALGPGRYPTVSETPSGRLRYKTIAIGRFVYNLTNIFQNAVTPRMLSFTGEPFSLEDSWIGILSLAFTLI